MNCSAICDEKQFEEFIDSLQPSISKEEYDIQYESFLRLSEKNLPYIYDLNHLSLLIGESTEQLDFFVRNKRKIYVSYRMKKKRGGYRTIDVPSKKLKFVQRWILQNILYIIKVSKHSHGFIPGRSIATNAKIHVGQELVMGIDLKDFFPSIKFNRVSGFFKSVGYNNHISTILAELCTFNWQLPQGAPTSPMISNLIASRLDKRLAGFCKKKKLLYSRYADDITISGGKVLPRYKTLIFRIITEEGFEINYEKVRIQGRGSRQLVTGLVVNDKVSIGRENKRTIKSLIHKVTENGPIGANDTNNPFFKEMIYGLLSFSNVVEPNFASPLLEMLKNIDWTNYYEEMSDSRESELIMRSLEKKHYYHPFVANKNIESEDDLLKAIHATFKELKRYIEDRRWTEPFWDDAQEVEVEGKKYPVLARPKSESKIQPTLHVFFNRSLCPLGVHVLRETDEGVGTLDFKFLVTIKGSIPINVCVEFKLAHNKKLEHGLTTQLPLYLKASPSNSGIFFIMWFKDEKGKYFNEPTNKSKSEMIKHLEEAIQEINENEEFKIESIIIDASKKPSASHS
ncbi:MAG: retron St85 family RNA-directed DNA polymerase [Methanosarcina sp.]|jgi:retron-type reverse transcriptase